MMQHMWAAAAPDDDDNNNNNIDYVCVFLYLLVQ